MSNINFLNPDEFKKWIKNQDKIKCEKSNLVGSFVESRYSGKKIARLISLESGKAGRVVREFLDNGGKIKAIEGNEYLIEVDSGSFYLNKRHIIF